MNTFKIKNLVPKGLVNKIVNAINSSRDIENKSLKREHFIEPKDDELTPVQKQFVQDVSEGMTEQEIEALKKKIGTDNTVINSYRRRTMLKDASTGQLKPKKDFAIDINFPARDFRAVKSIP